MNVDASLFQDLIYTVENSVCTLTMNRPQRRNALTPNLVNELIVALECANADLDVGSIVLCGSGGAFCAGADLAAMHGGAPLNDAIPQRGGFVELNLAFRNTGKPIIAKVERYALAGGLGLMCACQFAIAEESATFGTPEIDRGIFPMMIMANIFRLIPQRKGLELVLLGERWSSSEAEAIGLINRAVPSEKLDQAVDDLALKLASKAPNAMKLGLQAFYEQSDKDFEAALRYLEGQLGACLQTPDAVEGVTAFLEKRPVKWPPRQP